MRNVNAKKIAMCGVFAALAVVIMCICGLIPLATYVSPVLVMIIGCIIMKLVGKKYAWTWYIAVAFLSLLLSADKESAAIYLALGCYPYLKEVFEKSKLQYIWKLIYFNCVILCVYWLLIYVIGLQQVMKDFQGIGAIGIAVFLILGNAVFFMLDRILTFIVKRVIK